MEQVARHVPAGGVLRSVHVRAGALQMIETDAMNAAWGAITEETAHAGAVLDLEVLEPHRVCPECGRDWVGGELVEACVCGCSGVRWIDGEELTLVSMEVDVEEEDCVAATEPREV